MCRGRAARHAEIPQSQPDLHAVTYPVQTCDRSCSAGAASALSRTGPCRGAIRVPRADSPTRRPRRSADDTLLPSLRRASRARHRSSGSSRPETDPGAVRPAHESNVRGVQRATRLFLESCREISGCSADVRAMATLCDATSIGRFADFRPGVVHVPVERTCARARRPLESRERYDPRGDGPY